MKINEILTEQQGVAEGRYFKTSYGWAGGSKPSGGTYKHPEQIKADKEAKKKAKEKQKNKPQGVAEGWTDTLKSNLQLPLIKKLMALIEPYKNQVLQINNQAKKMKSQGSSPNEVKQFLKTNIESISSRIASNTLVNESEEFTKEEIAQLYKLISRQQWLTYLPLILTYLYDQLNLPNIWGDRGVYWWAYAWWIIVAIGNELNIREKKKKLDTLGAKNPDQELLNRLDNIKEGVSEGHADQQRKIFKRNGQPVGEVGIDRESSPGAGQWYMKCYAYDIDKGGYDSYEEAVAELKHCLKQGVSEGQKR